MKGTGVVVEQTQPDTDGVVFEALGPLRLTYRGNELDVGGTKQQTVLLALLLADGDVVSSDRLITDVWGERPPSKPFVTLRSYISHLRKVIEPDQAAGDRARTLVTRAPGYALEVPAERVDIRRFEALAAAASECVANDPERAVTAATEALALWRSPELSTGAFAAFASEAARLTELRIAVTETSNEAALNLGRHREAIGAMRSLVEAHPLRELPRRHLILALYRSGRVAEALEVYRDAETTLAEQLGIDPSPTLAGLDLQLLNNDPALDLTPSVTASITPPSIAPTSHARLVGRTRELEAGETALSSHGLSAAGSVIAITGEPGIGKTTLVTALADLGRRSGGRLAWGRCHDGGQATTLWPWVTALRDLIEPLSDSDLETVVGARAEDLAGLLPEVARRLGIEGRNARDLLTVFDAIIRVVRRLADHHPVILAFEDLHWADVASVRLLDLAGPALVDAPVTILATWRDTESLPAEVASALAGVGRLAGALRFDLAGLDDDAIVALYRHHYDDRPSKKTIDRLRALTAGNPLFLNEVLTSAAHGAEIGTTPTLRETIDARLSRLPTETAEILRIAALGRDGFSEEVLAEVSGVPLEDLLASLGVAMAAGIIEASPDHANELRFSHAVIAERLADQLSAPVRAELNARIGFALERRNQTSELLAHYFLRGATAGTAARGADYAARAARASAKLHDHDGAERLLNEALAALEIEDDPELRIDIGIDIAQEHKFHARYREAHAAASDAFERAEAIGDLRRMCVAALVYSGQIRAETNRFGTQWLGYWVPAGPCLDMLGRCLDKLDPTDPMRAGLLFSYAAQMFGEFTDVARAAEMNAEATALARELNDPQILTDGLFTMHTASQRSLDLETRRSILREIAETSRRHHLPERELSSHRASMLLALDERDRPGAERALAQAHGLIQRDDDYLIGLQSRSMDVALQIFDGHLEAADASIQNAFGEYARIGFASLEVFGIQFATVSRELGRHSIVRDLLVEREAGYPGPAYGLPLAAVTLEMGDDAAARRLLDGYPRDLVLSGGEGTLQFSNLAFAADLAVGLGDLDLAEQLFEVLLPARGRIVAMFDGLVLYGAASMYLGRLATSLGRFDDAEVLLNASLGHHDALAAQPWILRSRLALAELAAGRGQATTAQHVLATCTEQGADLGMSWLVAHRRALLDR